MCMHEMVYICLLELASGRKIGEVWGFLVL